MTKNAARTAPNVRLKYAFVVPDKFPAFDHKLIIYVLDVDGVEVRLGHWSGKFSGPVKTLARWIKKCMTRYSLDAMTTTEAQQKAVRSRVRARMGTKFTVRKRGEYLCILRKKTFFVMPAVDPVIKAYSRIAGYAGWRNMRAGHFTARHKELEIPFDWWDFHGPSGIQRPDGWSDEHKQVQIAKVGYPRLGAEMDRIEEKRPHGVRIAVGDTNWHAGDYEPGLKFMEQSLGAEAVFRPGRLPNQGTHGNSRRVIDNAFIHHSLDDDKPRPRTWDMVETIGGGRR